jgi:hypothetical protein
MRKIATAAAGLALAGMLLTATPASAAPATGVPNCHCNIGLPSHVTWHVQDEKPPLLTLLRVYVKVHAFAQPQQFTGLVTLWVYKLVMTRRGPQWQARRAKGAPAVHLTMSDLPAPGSSATWKFGGPPVYPDWYCKKSGRYFIAMSIHAVSHDGQPDHRLFYEPYLKGHPTNPKTAFGFRPPTRAEAVPVKC